MSDFTTREANQLAIILADICHALDLPAGEVDSSGTSQLMLEINAGIEARKKLASLSPPPDLPTILTAIENYCGDDFSEDLDMQDATGTLTGPLKEAHTRLSEIYKLAHAFNTSHSCYHVHQDWRDKLAPEPPPPTATPPEPTI